LPAPEGADLANLLARKAAEDATGVREFAGNSRIADSLIGFHAEQAVEKWLKAVIASYGQEFEYTHDLRHLIALAKAACGGFPFDTAQVIELTEYAVPLRYEELLDAEPLDRGATVALVDAIGRWAEAALKGGAER
jgi:HEPN domain-containing protein